MKNTKSITSFEVEITQLKIENAKLSQEIRELRALNEWYAEQFKLAQQLRYGVSSEKSILPEQMRLFNEAEVIVDEILPEPIIEETITYTRKKRVGKRDEIYDGLPTVQEVYELPEEERVCPICGGALHACGHETVRREIEVIPATIRAKEIIQTVYGCRDCEKNADDDTNAPMIKSAVPAPVISGSGIASPSLVAFILSNKYVLALPLSRQEQELERQGITISRQTMANWCIFVASKWLKPIFDLLHATAILCNLLQADETTLQVINEPNRKASTNSYIWAYLTGKYAVHQVVLFEYTETRAGRNPQTFLSGFTGFLNVDGYAGYHALESLGVTLCGCFTHVRRKFADVLKTVPKHLQKDHVASVGIAYCDRLFELERQFDDKGLNPDERYERRQLKSKSVVLAFIAWAEKLLPSLPDKGKMREAVVYVVNQQSRLLSFLLDGRIEISNNRAERAIRPFTIGRNNWMFAYSPKGAKASAIIYSIVETSKANGLIPFKYLEFLLETLPNIPVTQYADCLPWNVTARERCSASSL